MWLSLYRRHLNKKSQKTTELKIQLIFEKKNPKPGILEDEDILIWQHMEFFEFLAGQPIISIVR